LLIPLVDNALAVFILKGLHYCNSNKFYQQTEST